ncbi:MAG: molecular chaperone DnaK, partial [Planctomycetaceae bacterium]
EALCFQTEKLIKEHDAKLSAAEKAPLEAAIAKARETDKGEDVDAITSAHSALEQATQALSKVLYESTAQQRGGATPEGASDAAGAGKGPDDTIDAEFEVKG